MAKLSSKQTGVVGAAIGFSAGFALGYLVARRHLWEKYKDLAEKEVAEVREYLLEKQRELANQEKPDIGRVLHPSRRFTPEEEQAIDEANAEAEAYMKEHEGFAPPKTDPRTGDVWDYSKEVPVRTPERPYVIHVDEFMELNARDGEDWQTSTLTYYEGDDVLVDERNEVITNRDEIVGEENLGKFGHGSEDPNVVLVRNERLTSDLEICKDPGHYAVEVLGLEMEPEPEPTRQSRRRSNGGDDEDES